jgi:hypothetical protein
MNRFEPFDRAIAKKGLTYDVELEVFRDGERALNGES